LLWLESLLLLLLQLLLTSLLLQVFPTFLASLLLLAFLLWSGVFAVACHTSIACFPSPINNPFANGFLLFLASLLLLVSSDVPYISCAAVCHAVAVYITAVLSPLWSLLAGNFAVAAVSLLLMSLLLVSSVFQCLALLLLILLASLPC
jgi:hypothetical protein